MRRHMHSRNSTDSLAIIGGKPAVKGEYREKWRKVCWRQIYKILLLMLRDINDVRGTRKTPREFERRFADFIGVRYAIAMSNGTATLHSALVACGVSPGDEVIAPAYTFYGTATPVLQCGAVPVFCDVDPATLTADPADVFARITPRTRAVCVAHPWGNPARIEELSNLCRERGLFLIEDCSGAHGATYKGRPVGSWGNIGCFSLQGGKPVSGGEAGVVVTDDPVLHARMIAFGQPGRKRSRYEWSANRESFGLKYRPHIYGVVMANENLTRLQRMNSLMRNNYELLSRCVDPTLGITSIGTNHHAIRGGWTRFPLRIDFSGLGISRQDFLDAARAEGAPIRKGGYPGLNKLPIFTSVNTEDFGGILSPYRGHDMDLNTPNTKRAVEEIILLPAFTRVREAYIRQCAGALNKVAGHAADSRDE